MMMMTTMMMVIMVGGRFAQDDFHVNLLL